MDELKNMKQINGYYILDENQRYALGFNNTLQNSFAMYNKIDGEYKYAEYKDKLSLYEISEYHFDGIDTDKALKILTDIKFDFVKPLESFEKSSSAFPFLPLPEFLAGQFYKRASAESLSESEKARIIETAEYMRNYHFPYDVKGREEHNINKNKEKEIKPPVPTLDPSRKTIYVCSPLAGAITENIRKAREYSKFVATQGATPIAPHVTEIFNDSIPEEREMGLNMGLDYLRKADELWVFGNTISSGMAAEIKLAQEELHIPIYHVGAPPYELSSYENDKEELKMARPPITEEQKQMAKQTDLFLYVQGRYNVKEHGPNTYKLVENGHDSVVLFPETNTWYDYVNQVGGDTISFLTEHEGKNFVAAVKELVGEISDPRKIFRAPPTPIKKERTPLILPNHDANDKRVFAYLIKTRGIDRDIVAQCIHDKSVYQSKENISKNGKSYTFSNCIFVGRDTNGDAKYASQRSMNDDSPYILKADVQNSNKHFGFSILGKESTDWVTVCEAPIDVMSYASLNKLSGRDNADEHIISLGGVSTLALDTFLETHPNVKTINIALDNDRAGRLGGEAIKLEFIEKGYTVVESYPKEKDYNLELQKYRLREAAPHIEIPAQSADNKQSLTQLISVKHIDKEIAGNLFKEENAYQVIHESETAGGEKELVVDTMFVRRNEHGDPLYAISASHTDAKNIEFKVEYANEERVGCYLFQKGQTNTLLVFNNPISMLTYQTIQKAKKETPDHCICCITHHDKAIAEYIQNNNDVQIRQVDVALDEAKARSSKTQQIYDYREAAFSKIRDSFSSSEVKVKVTKRFPSQPSLNQDLTKAMEKGAAKLREKQNEKTFENDYEN